MKFEDFSYKENREIINKRYNQSFPSDLFEREGYELSKGLFTAFYGMMVLEEQMKTYKIITEIRK